MLDVQHPLPIRRCPQSDLPEVQEHGGLAPRLSLPATEHGFIKFSHHLSALPFRRRAGVWANDIEVSGSPQTRAAGRPASGLSRDDVEEVPVLGLAHRPLGFRLFFQKSFHIERRQQRFRLFAT